MIKILLQNYWELIYRFKKEVFIAVISSILAASLEASAIYILVKIITNITDSSISNIVSEESISNSFYAINTIYILVIFITLAICASILYFISQKYIVRIKCLVEKYVRKSTSEAIIKMNWIHFIRLNQGDLSKSILAEGQQIAEGCMFLISATTYLCISLTYLLSALILVSNSLLILILYGLLAYTVYRLLSKRTARLGKGLSSITSSIGNSTSAIFGNLKYIRANNLNKQALKDSSAIFTEFAKAYEKTMTSSYLTKGIMEIITSLFIFVALLYIIYSRSSNYGLILSLALFIRMAPNIYNLQSRLLDATALISWPKLYRDRIKNALAFRDSIIIGKEETIKISGDINFRDISFYYPNTKPIFEKLNLTLKEKTIVSIIGKSGEGKSTISDLLTGLIKPIKGEIYIGNAKLDEHNMNSWRSSIGIVMQDNYLINDSIANNIALGEDKVDHEKVERVLKEANCWDFIKSLPEGVNESVLERGIRFSGGQRQRIALARALYREPKLLILDEPTSALDQNAEESIISTLNKIKGSLTILIISHKERIAKIADKIYLLKKGKLTDREGLIEDYVSSDNSLT